MGIREVLFRISAEYLAAKVEPQKEHPLAEFIRNEAKEEIERALTALDSGLLVEGSPGRGVWAAVPWVGIFDPVVTDTATAGYYAVYLFHVVKPIVYLSLNQGTTKVREEFKGQARNVLEDRAELMRKRLADLAAEFPVTKIDLGSDARLPGDYAAGHALGFTYDGNNLPPEAKLRSDLLSLARVYKSLVFRGGIDDVESALADEEIPPNATLIETRRYVYHRKIERNPKAARQAKKFHGSKCQACDLEMHLRYGEIGKDFIEAHHLKPISSLKEGQAISYEIATDFAVLCPNCHRMIHKTEDPSDMAAFKKQLIL